jgi:hypothetical protein
VIHGAKIIIDGCYFSNKILSLQFLKNQLMKKITLLAAMLIGLPNLLLAQCTANTKSITLNGTTSYVSFTTDNNLQLDSAITVEAWIKPSAFGPNHYSNSIACKHSWSLNGEQGFVLRCGGSGQLSFTFCGVDTLGNTMSWQPIVSPANTLTLNTWAHVAASFDGDSSRLYVNGIKVASQYFHGTMKPNTAYPMRIGRLSDAAQSDARAFNGQIDEVRIWNIAKPQGEILAGYNRHISPTSTGLVGYWNFNIASGTTVPDQTSSGNTATFNTITLSPNVPFFQATTAPVITANGLNLSSSLAFTYQWNYNGQPIANATTQNYTVTQNGTYTVSITDSIGCPAISSPVIINTVGVQEMGNAQQIKLYNGDGYIRIDANNGTELRDICIYNCGGAMIEELKNPLSSNMINTERIIPGVYLVMVMTENDIYRSKIFIK